MLQDTHKLVVAASNASARCQNAFLPLVLDSVLDRYLYCIAHHKTAET